MRRTPFPRIVLVYPCATHSPDVVYAVTAVADCATHLALARGKKDGINGKTMWGEDVGGVANVTGKLTTAYAAFN